MPGMSRKRWVLVLLLLGLAIGLYAAAGFWGVPKLLRAEAGKYVRETLHRDLRLGQVRFNPFTLELDLRDAAILEHGQPLVGVARFHANYQIASLFSGEHTLREVTLVRPYARAIIRPDGSLNLADLLPESDPNTPTPRLLIETFTVSGGQIDFADQSLRLKPTKTLAPITFSIRDLRTGGGYGAFRLDTRTEDGEGLAWRGRLSLQPIASTGHFDIRGLQAGSVQKFLADKLPFVLTAGSIDLAGDYTFAVDRQRGMRLDATLPKVSATALALRAHGTDENWVTLPAVAVEGITLSLARHQAEIKAVRASGLQVRAWLEADGSMSLERLFTAVPATDTPAKPAPAATAATMNTPAPEWQLHLAELALDDGHISLEDRSVRPAGRFELAPVSARIGDLSLDPHEPATVSVTTRINGEAPLHLQGSVVPATASADLRVELSALPLSALQMYLPNYPDLTLRSGAIAANGTLSLRPDADPGPALRYDGEASIDHFNLVEKANQRSLVAWDRVDLLGIAYTMAPDRLKLQRIEVRKPVLHVVVAPDQTLNLASALSATTPGPGQAPATTAKRTGSLPPVNIHEIVLDRGTMDFADLSITPNFQARIDALRGRISNISTSPGTIAKIALSGQVIDRYSPVTIDGEINPLAYDEMSDLRMSFRNIELPVFNPYSGRFAGYAIAKGKLTTELHYTIDHRKLKADHHVIIDQLQWGQATDSKDKVSLPIRLATALLKDVHGVIDLNLPVSGTLDDPKFRIGPVVWQIVKNLVVKVATAPFRFLGSMFKGAEDAQFVDFQPGSATLPDKTRTALLELAGALAERPEVMLDIPAGSVTEADATALDEQAFQAAIARLQQGRRNAGTSYAALDDADRIDLLDALYKQEFQHAPVLPDPATLMAGVEAAAGTTSPGDAAGPADTQAVAAPAHGAFSPFAAVKARITRFRDERRERKHAEVVWLEAQLRPRFKADPSAAPQLAQARAKAVQEALLGSGKLDPTRVFLATNLSPVDKDGMARLQLALK